MSKIRASLIHLAISTVLVAAVFAVVFWVWYPAPAFEVAGAWSIVKLLIGVDLVLGPLLTLVVYRHNKPGLKFDLTVIAVIQLTALVYGATRLYQEKPDYLVFAFDRAEFVASKHVNLGDIRFAELNERLLGKLTKVYARRPTDPQEFQRFLDSTMFEGKPDLERRPEYWEPWANGATDIRQRALPLAQIEPKNDIEAREKQQSQHRYPDRRLGLIPVGATEKDISLLLDIETLEVLDAVSIDSWP